MVVFEVSAPLSTAAPADEVPHALHTPGNRAIMGAERLPLFLIMCLAGRVITL